MSDDALMDRLRELGIERVTLWHLRAVEAYLRGLGSSRYYPALFRRLMDDLRGEEYVWLDAQQEDARRARIVRVTPVVVRAEALPLDIFNGRATRDLREGEMVTFRVGDPALTPRPVVHQGGGPGDLALCGTAEPGPYGNGDVSCPSCLRILYGPGTSGR